MITINDRVITISDNIDNLPSKVAENVKELVKEIDKAPTPLAKERIARAISSHVHKNLDLAIVYYLQKLSSNDLLNEVYEHIFTQNIYIFGFTT